MVTTPQYRKKLIEVALPLEAINKESAHEKTIRHGVPSNLHLWWAPRPLVACRAVLFASLVDDPSSWPELFPTEEKQKAERERLFKIIEELVKWENSSDAEILFKAHTEIASSIARRRGENLPEGANARLQYIAKYAPPLLDPFCGRGFIPLEAQRLGLEAHGSDLNPMAVIIAKALVEIPPKFAGQPPINPVSKTIQTLTGKWKGTKGLAEDVEYYGKWMLQEAEKQIGCLYPKIKVTAEMAKGYPKIEKYIGQELTVIAWLWARTVASPNPTVDGVHIPLVRSFWLSIRKGQETWIEPIVNREENSYRFVIRTRNESNKSAPEGTMNRKGGRCLISGVPIPYPYIRAEAKAGRMNSRLMAIVLEGNNERIYIPPTDEQVIIAQSAIPSFKPEEEMPKKHRNFQPPVYGMNAFGDLFTPRQLVALTTFSDLIKQTREKIIIDASVAKTLTTDDRRLDAGGIGILAYADAVAVYLSFIVDKLSDLNNSLCTWKIDAQCPVHMFSRQAIPMCWDYTESNPLSASSGSWNSMIKNLTRAMNDSCMPAIGKNHEVKQLDATADIYHTHNLLISTDPPYYDNIAYSDLSDFFYVWLRRSLNLVYPSLFATVLTPKTQELVASPSRHNGDRDAAMNFFEQGFGKAFSKIHDTLNFEYPLTVYYAFKQTETDEGDGEFSSSLNTVSTGWETMLTGLIVSGFIIQGTWPMRTEMKARQTALNSNALASSIVLVCRPRPTNAPLATRREFIAVLKQELPSALKTLQQSSIAPVDLAQAAIGPGMAVFTRYTKVMESDGSPMTVRTALGLINQTLAEVLAAQDGEFDADTRWALAWFEQFGMSEGAFGTAETLSRAKNTAINALVEDGLIIAKAGKVRLVPRDELQEDWDPATDKRPTVWESTQHLIRALDQKGEPGAADLLRKLGSGMGETARDLAYSLYIICDRKKWPQEAVYYNSLITSWLEIQNLVHAAEHTRSGQQKFTEENE